MAIYQLFEQEKNEQFTETFDPVDAGVGKKSKKSQFFSTVLTRFCFLLLLIADTAWFIYNVLVLSCILLGNLLTGCKSIFFKKMLFKFGLQLRRSVLCGLALFIGLFSPPFGIMVACTYFLMYDKAGMEEVVPAALQSQFKDIFQTEK